MLTLSSIDVELEYLAEGAANVVYRIHPPGSDLDVGTAADLQFESNDYDSDTPLPSEIPPLQLDPRLSGKLVRLRKDLPHSMPVEECQERFETIIKPLFQKENLVEAELFNVSSELLKDCNSNLRKMEKAGRRPAKRHGIYLIENAKHGCLITDMSWPIDNTFTCFEFKPKWLVQSPTAPAGSRRCRTCALRAKKRGSLTDQPERSKSGFCPLALISPDMAMTRQCVDHIISSSSSQPSEDVQVRLVDFLYQNPLLERIKKLQRDLDPHGVFTSNLISSQFLAAMTLRDCSLFLKVIAMSMSKSRHNG